MTKSLLQRLDRPVVLVGLMGAGKSTIGRRLAKRLDLPFVDSDDAIIDASGYTPTEIFERFGEEDFRDGERRVVARLIDEGDIQVIATGGGAYTDEQTRKLLNERAITVWLDAEIDILAERTRRPDTRPLLKGDVKQRKRILADLADKRRDDYANAHLHVRSGKGAHDVVVDAIVDALADHLDAQ